MDAGTALATVGKDYLPTMLRNAAQKLAAAETAAEVLEARAAATELYDEAKKAARLAKAKGAHDTVITTIYRVQADGLEIEAAAKRRLADEYDAAQAAGEVKTKADNQHASSKREEAASEPRGWKPATACRRHAGVHRPPPHQTISLIASRPAGRSPRHLPKRAGGKFTKQRLRSPFHEALVSHAEH